MCCSVLEGTNVRRCHFRPGILDRHLCLKRSPRSLLDQGGSLQALPRRLDAAAGFLSILPAPRGDASRLCGFVRGRPASLGATPHHAEPRRAWIHSYSASDSPFRLPSFTSDIFFILATPEQHRNAKTTAMQSAALVKLKLRLLLCAQERFSLKFGASPTRMRSWKFEPEHAAADGAAKDAKSGGTMRVARCEKKQKGLGAMTGAPRSARRALRRESRERCRPRRRRRSCATQLFRPSVGAGAAAASEGPRRSRRRAASRRARFSCSARGAPPPVVRGVSGAGTRSEATLPSLIWRVFRGIEPANPAVHYLALPELL